MIRYAFALACVLAVPFAAPTVGHAADDKTAPGSNCVPSTGNDPGGTRFLIVDSAFYYGDAGGPLRADCPIMKERVGKGIRSASVFVVDDNQTADVECELFSRRVTPNQAVTGTNSPTRSSSGKSLVARELKLGALPAVPGTGSYWFIGCDLPPNTGILSYYVDEQQ